MATAFLLLKLQQFDSKLDKVAQRLTVIDTALDDKSQLTKATNLHDAISTKFDSLIREREKLERDLQDLSGKMESADKKVYGGIISSQKELRAVEEEILNIKNLTDSKENQLLETMLECDRYQDGHKTSRQELKRIQTETEKNTERFEQERDDLKTFMSTNIPIRDKARQECNLTDLTIYDRLRKRKKGVAVSVIESDLCSICRVKVPNRNIEDAKHSDQYVHCNSCGRILCID